MAVINFIRNDNASIDLVRLQDGQVVFDIDGETVKMYHDLKINGEIKRVPITGGTSVSANGENLVFS